jgi:hypothetical protein
MSTRVSAGMSRRELLALPAAVDLVTAGRALGLGRTKSHELARAGEFPVRVLRLGRAYRVATADVLALLGIEPTGSTHGAHTPATTSNDEPNSGPVIRGAASA